MHAPRGCVVVEAEEVAAHAAAVRLRDGEHGVDGNGGIDHGPARSQHVHARQGGERMGGGDEAAASERNRTPRVTDLWHAQPPAKSRVISSRRKTGSARSP